MKRDILSAYGASVARLGSWVIVLGFVYRFVGSDAFAMLALVRGTIGLLNYVSLGLAPAMIRQMGRTPPEARIVPTEAVPGSPLPLSYYSVPRPSPLEVLLANALPLAFLSGMVGIVVCTIYAAYFQRIYGVSPRFVGEMTPIVLCIGVGAVFRLTSDAPGAAIQVAGRIALDNLILICGDILWVALATLFILQGTGTERVNFVADAYLVCGALVFYGRLALGIRSAGRTSGRGRLVDWTVMASLLSYGFFVVAAQLADYLYSPTDYILIGRLLTAVDLANYAPATQIDSGLLLLVTGLSAVLLPKTAMAHAAGSGQTIRRYYVRGTLASVVLLAVGSLAIWGLSPFIFRLWLGSSMSDTRAVLPLVLLNTTIGGSAAVGRSILIAVGKARAFTLSALVAGVMNVLCSYAFVRYLHWGLRGIILGTVVAVVVRCVVWMPWYVMRTIRPGITGQP